MTPWALQQPRSRQWWRPTRPEPYGGDRAGQATPVAVSGPWGSSTSIYLPLSGPNRFRLLMVHPAGGDGHAHEIRCNLLECALDESEGTYQALSYAWGDPSPTKHVTINNMAFPVRPNLYSFLHALSATLDKPFTIWIDAVCIDQDSIEERNHQVSVMDIIYRQATQVVVWFGQVNPDLGYELSTIEWTASPDSGSTTGPTLETILGDKCFLWKGSDLVDSICTMLDNIECYLSRIWIVQELLLARSITVYCGSQQLPWPATNIFLGHLLEHFTPHSGDSNRLRRWLVEIQEHQNADVSFDIVPLMDIFSRRDCRDAHDRIYALLGIYYTLGPRASRERMKIDYSEPLFEMLLRFVRTWSEPDRSRLGSCLRVYHALVGFEPDQFEIQAGPTRAIDVEFPEVDFPEVMTYIRAFRDPGVPITLLINVGHKQRRGLLPGEIAIKHRPHSRYDLLKDESEKLFHELVQASTWYSYTGSSAGVSLRIDGNALLIYLRALHRHHRAVLKHQGATIREEYLREADRRVGGVQIVGLNRSDEIGDVSD